MDDANDEKWNKGAASGKMLQKGPFPAVAGCANQKKGYL